MTPANYFLPEAANQDDFSAWSPLIALPQRVLATNLFGDAFVVDEDGAVLMLERGACSVTRLTESDEEFWHRIEQDADGWQLRPLADRCRSAGKVLGPDQCYAFITPPVLGGKFEESNIWVAPWREFYAITVDIYSQIKDLPEGTKISFTVGD